MTQYLLMIANVTAIGILIFGIYFPRHRRRDMVVAYLAINTGVLAIAGVLSSLSASVGLGLGLFGVLSIIRLRSDELDQAEVAYYFVSLALGLLGGTDVNDSRLSLALMAALVLVVWIGDHPRLLGHYRAHRLVLDRAFVDERELIAHLSELLGARIRRIAVRSVDLVNDTTIVDVRFETGTGVVSRRLDARPVMPATEPLP